MATTLESFSPAGPPGRHATVDIVVPVYNEERVLDFNIRRLRRYLDEQFPFSATVIIADNASTDRTWETASRLAAQHGGIRAVHLDEKGRGRALRAAWSSSEAVVVAYMDVDMATDLDALLPLIAPLLSGHSDVSIGSRLANGSRVVRGPKREVISRLYNLILRATMRNGFTDAQCGFKALRADAARSLLPLVADESWFFDTELLVLAEANGMRIHEVPVDWVDDPDSRVDMASAAWDDLRGLARVSRRLAAGDFRTATVPARATAGAVGSSRFAGIGGLSTVAYLLVLVLLRPAVGILAANAISLSLAALGNFAAHRHYTLPTSGPGSAAERRNRRSFADEALLAFAVGLGLSTVALAAVATVSTSIVSDLVAVVAANAVVSAGRFVSFRARMFRQHRQAVEVSGHPRPPVPSTGPSRKDTA